MNNRNQKPEDIMIYNYDDENIRNKIESQLKNFLVCIKHLMRERFKDNK